MAPTELLDRLKNLTSAQFEEVILRANIPQHYLPPNSVALVSRAIALINLCQNTPWMMEALSSAIKDVSLVAPTPPPPDSIKTGTHTSNPGPPIPPATKDGLEKAQKSGHTQSNTASPSSAPPPTAPPQLVEAIRTKKALFIVGAGVSIAATKGQDCASWIGLLENGLQTLKRPPFNRADSEIAVWQSLLATKSIHALISVAQFVSDTLNTGGGGQFRRWLKNTVGNLKAQDSSILDALLSTSCPIATTNYDNLLCKASGRERITWKEPAKIHEVIRGDREGIIHLHGHYDEADSVILGFSDYAQLTKVSTQFQDIQKALIHGHTLVLVGCGAGSDDPNMSALLTWLGRVYGDSIYEHYRLERQSHVQSRQKGHGLAITVLSYGEQYSDLSGYIGALAGND